MGNIYRNRRMDFCKNPMEVMRWALLALAVVTFSTPASSSEPRVVCYYTNWSVYRPGTAKFNPQNINPYLCTHLIYAFGGFTKDNTLKPFDKYQDIEKGGYAKFTGLKTYNQKLKTLLAIGGWNEGSSRFSPMVASKEKRKEFVRNAIKFLRQNRFDGLDLDWEYPAFRDGGKPKDRENYAKLVKELREEFERESEKTGKPRLLLTMAVPAGIEYIQKGFDVKTLNQYLDWMNLLTYDYHSAFEPAVNHHAPLYPLEEPNEYSVDNELNIDYTIKFYLENGADPDKLVLGIPTYGRSYTLFNPDATEIGSPADGPGDQGDATREKGYLAYYEICESLKPKEKKKRSSDEDSEEEDEDSSEQDDQPWTLVQPNANAMGPFAYKGNQWVGYDDKDIVKKKGEYVAENGLGGIMFWSIDNDDFRGACHGKPYPLIEAAKEAYILKLGSTDNAIVSSGPTPRPSSSNRRRNRPRVTSTTAKATTRSQTTRKPALSTTPSWANTPEPPTTPDPGSDFKCTDEGFFPHPRDCKKYFWCLDSGPSNLGIVAHQFTCPSGLFFNKAADSCDFARNVLCRKPASTTKAPTTKATTESTTQSTTTRRPIKLTTRNSALFRTTTTTTSTTTTTTPAPEEEEFEEVDDASDIEAEDPKVIKELIDLIKKVGGVEQLEKQLGLFDSASPSSETVTLAPARFNKKLYQKVLEKTRGKTNFGTKKALDTTNAVNSVQNSRRGPQNAGLEVAEDKDKLLRKDRPQYTSINRSRQSTSTTEALIEEQTEASRTFSRSRQVAIEEVPEERSVSSTAKPLQYVNIRRARPTSDTADDSASRNALFERSEPYVTISETPGTVDIVSARRENVLEYVTIRRQRPSLEETTTIAYKPVEEEEFQESQETALEREISSPVSPQYTTIVRQRPSTFAPTPEEVDTQPPTTVLSVQLSSLLNNPVEEEAETEVAEQTTMTTTTTTAPTTTTAAATTPRRVVSRRRSTTTPAPSTTISATVTQALKDRRRNFVKRTRPSPSPFSITPTVQTDTETTTGYAKRGNPRFKSRNEVAAKNDTSRQPSLNSGVGARTERPRNFVRRKLGGANGTTTTTVSASFTASLATRRPYRLVTGRRRLVPSSTKATTTTKVTTVETTTTESPTTQRLAYEETLQDVLDESQPSVTSLEDASIEDNVASSPLPKKTVKIQRRPLTSLKEIDQNPSATNEEERKRQSKKYSSTFRQNQLDEVLKQKRIQEETTVSGTTVDGLDAETAVAIAAHQLIRAPLPTGANDLEDIPVRKTTPSRTTVDYSFTSPGYSSKSATSKPVFIEEFSTPSYKSSSLVSSYLTEISDSYNGQTPTGFTKTSGGFTPSYTRVASYPITSPSIISPGVSSLGPSTARYLPGARRYTGVSLDNLGYNQEPAYFTREYLLESPVTKTYDGEYQYLSPTTPGPTTKTLPKKVIFRKISTTIKPTTKPFVALPAVTAKPRRVPSKKPFEKISKTQPQNYNSKPSEYLPDNFDYYDDQNEKVVQKYAEGTKVIVRGKGSIECLDIGNFPHPTSCKKFISCARLESGAIIGWEYVCPSGLSFDPVGGMCNWAAGLGCDDKGA